MVIRKKDVVLSTQNNVDGAIKMYNYKLNTFEGQNKKVSMFSHIKLNPNEQVDFHIHNNEFESYYILSGKGLYKDNETLFELEAGDVTYTPSGSGHGIKNIGETPLEFIALIVKD